MRSQYEKVLAERVTAPFDAAKADLDAKFTAALDRIADEAKKEGKLDAVLAILEDERRLANKFPLPEDDDATPDSLKKLRGIYREQLTKLEEQRTANHTGILPAYTEKLKALETTLTKADRIDEAREVMSYRESLTAPGSSANEAATAAPVAAGGGVKLEKLPQREVAEWVLSVGGKLGLMEGKRRIDASTLEELPRGKFSIVRIKLPTNKKRPFTDEDLDTHLGILPDLQAFVLFYVPVTDAGLQFLHACPKLQFLESDGCKLTDAVIDIIASRKDMNRFTIANDAEFHGKGIEALRALPIGMLNFKNTAFGDAELETLKKFKSLTEVVLIDTPVTDEALAAFKKARPDVKVTR
ncbi:MAG: hypothetical protein K1X78_16805 [Verrucomicrobiaceae bacterium]|nr:hypothetical protein [Verrucomicrobiaceae bacterium]